MQSNDFTLVPWKFNFVILLVFAIPIKWISFEQFEYICWIQLKSNIIFRIMQTIFIYELKLNIVIISCCPQFPSSQLAVSHDPYIWSNGENIPIEFVKQSFHQTKPNVFGSWFHLFDVVEKLFLRCQDMCYFFHVDTVALYFPNISSNVCAEEFLETSKLLHLCESTKWE